MKTLQGLKEGHRVQEILTTKRDLHSMIISSNFFTLQNTHVRKFYASYESNEINLYLISLQMNYTNTDPPTPASTSTADDSSTDKFRL